MRLTTKGRYAVTAMLDLALNGQSHPVCLADISKRQNISLSYLEQLFSRLRAASLVRSVRGPGGGYCLNATTNDISVADIVAAVNETIDATRCGHKEGCQDGETCLTHHLWFDLSEHIEHFLKSVSLKALCQNPEVLKVADRQREKMPLATDADVEIHYS